MKQILLKTWLIIVCLLVGVGTTWGEDITFTTKTNGDISATNTTKTKSGVSVVLNDGDGTALSWQSDHVRFYHKGSKITISSTSSNITKVVINALSGYSSADLKVNGTSINCNNTKTIYTFELQSPSAGPITIINDGTAQARIKSIVVTIGNSAPATPYTVTFSDGGSVTEETAGAGVSLPSRSQVGDYTFSGWCEQEVEETTTKPTIIQAGSYKPTKDTTLYPVYQKTEGEAGTTGTATASSGLTASMTAQALETGKPITYKMSASNNYSDPLRVYKGNTLTFAGATITKIVLTGNDSNNPATNLVLQNGQKGTRTTNGNSVTWEGEETTVVFNASSAQARVSTIVVTYTTGSTQTTYYTSNPSGTTKSLLSNLSISGTYPTSFYVGDEFSSEGIVVRANYSDESQVDVTSKASFKGYNMNTAGNYEVTVEYTENGVTASAKYNITVSEIPTYKVTIDEPENGSIQVMHNDLQVLTGDEFKEKESLTITATASEGYRFKKIIVTDDSSHEFMVNPKQWTMGKSNITITAKFERIPVYTINWSVNGRIIQTDNIKEGDPVVAPSVTVPTGTTKVFTGNWVATSTVDATTTPAYVTLSIASEDKTYYAVFADAEEGSGETEYTLDNETIKNAYVANVTTSYGTEEKTISDWKGKCIVNLQNGKYFVQINKNANNYYLSSPTYSSAISKVTVNTTGDTSSSTKTAAGRKFYLCPDNETAQPSEGVYGEGAIAEDNGSVTIKTTGDPTQFYLYTDGTARIASIVVTCGSPAEYSNFCTTIEDQVTANLKISDLGWGTFIAPFNCEKPEGVTLYKVSAVGPTSGVLTMKEEEGDVIKANTPYLVKSTGAIQEDFTGCPTNTESTYTEGLLTGNLGNAVQVARNAGNYLLQYNNNVLGFYLVASDNLLIGKNRCYLTVPAESGVKGAFFAISDTEDAIKLILDENEQNTEMYDLSGRRLTKKPAKGIYIVGGKKVMVK